VQTQTLQMISCTCLYRVLSCNNSLNPFIWLIAKAHGAKDDVINSLLSSNTMNHGLAMIPRKYSDILVGQFEIGNVLRINRKNNENTISNKIFDTEDPEL
jgi:hypothetical protein